MFPRLSTDQKKSLPAIQNNTVRTIFRISKLQNLSTKELCAKAGLGPVEDRAKNLNQRYFVKAILGENILIKNLVESLLSREEFN